MDWENENWIKMYTRDTADIISIGPEGRAIWWELMRKLDRSGLIDIPDADLVVLADILRIPWEWFQVGFPKILARGMAEFRGGRLIVKNFLPAQDARSSDAQRQRESRQRRRAVALGQTAQLDLQAPDQAAELSRNVTEPSHGVTSRVEEIRVGEIPRSLAHPSGASVTELMLEEIYKLYPRKQGKVAGIKAALTKVRDLEDLATLRAVVQRMQKAWAGHDTTYCPHFSTFIRQARWRDETPPLPGEPLPGSRDRWTRPVDTGRAPAPPRDRFEGADEDDIGGFDLDDEHGGLQ